MRPLLQPIHGRKIDRILVQVLQRVRHDQHGQKPEVDLAQHALDFLGRELGVPVLLVDVVAVVAVCGRGLGGGAWEGDS